MNTLLRSILLASFMGALLVGCGAAEDAADAAADVATEAADTAVEAAGDAAEAAGDAVEAAAEVVSNEPGGYVLSEEDRIPGITE